MDALARLERMLRPAAGGIYTVSTGTAEQLRIQQLIYGAVSEADVRERWRASLARLPAAKLVVLAVPSDVGAGFMRGASFGPQAIRQELLRRGSVLYRDPRVVDLGDVLVVPQLLHDEMLSEAQLRESRAALYGAPEVDLPVSPLSIAEQALGIVRALAPSASLLLLGGDHSVGWPGLAATARGREHRVGILHFDAHTDLLEHRLGVRYCFATWAYHANALIGRRRRLQQVGLRVSRRSRAEWERELDVRQYWMEEMTARRVEDVAEELIASLRAAGVEGVYISNDIDGTDPSFALATGTPEPGGLHPDTVTALIEAVGAAFPVWGSDLVEVAPGVSGHAEHEPSTTLATAARYVETQARVTLAHHEDSPRSS
jgi:arginase family enzyme